jgi:hypothetical protein
VECKVSLADGSSREALAMETTIVPWLILTTYCSCWAEEVLASPYLQQDSWPEKQGESSIRVPHLAPWSPSRELEMQQQQQRLNRVQTIKDGDRSGSSDHNNATSRSSGVGEDVPAVFPETTSTASPSNSSPNNGSSTATQRPHQQLFRDAIRLLSVRSHEQNDASSSVHWRAQRWGAVAAVITIIIVVVGAMMAVCVVYSRHLRLVRARCVSFSAINAC